MILNFKFSLIKILKKIEEMQAKFDSLLEGLSVKAKKLNPWWPSEEECAQFVKEYNDLSQRIDLIAAIFHTF